MDKEKEEYKENSQAVQAHLNILQSVIQRMSSNSTSCKTWCITLVSAILVVVANKDKPQYSLIAIIPIALFLVLDSYYLSLEKRFRKSYNNFIDKLYQGKIVAENLYAVNPSGNAPKVFFVSLFSFSVWPFYLMLIVMVLLAKLIVLR